MPFVSSRGIGPPAGSIMYEAWESPYDPPGASPRIEDNLGTMIVTKASDPQEAFFAPATWAEEIDRHQMGSELGLSIPSRRARWLRWRGRPVHPAVYRRIWRKPFFARGYPIEARRVASAALAAAIAKRDREAIKKILGRGRRRRGIVRERRQQAVELRRRMKRARLERRKREAEARREMERRWKEERRERVAAHQAMIREGQELRKKKRAAYQRKMEWWQSLDPRVRGRIRHLKPSPPPLAVPTFRVRSGTGISVRPF